MVVVLVVLVVDTVDVVDVAGVMSGARVLPVGRVSQLMPPPLAPAQMGGTGLSGLALADDRATPFKKEIDSAPATKIFFLANPITSVINVVRATPDGPRYRYAKAPDFLTTDDRWFRPVAMAFGPDGALYIVDWYNKIISHNEVPRTHPDRDKARGRIWRVRHRAQP